jgi:hypothetical protein
MSALLSTQQHTVHVIEFSGQRERKGEFSVYNSCADLSSWAGDSQNAEDTLIFGVCSGALAALWTACHIQVAGVFCWELPLSYKFTRASVSALARKYHLRIDWSSALVPVDPLLLAQHCAAPVMFGCSDQSTATSLSEQRILAAATQNAHASELSGTGHFPGRPIGSAVVLAQAVRAFADCLRHVR